MELEGLNCSYCGTPMTGARSSDASSSTSPDARFWVLLYCNSLIRVHADQGAPKVTLESHLDTQELEAVKQMLVLGRRQDAILCYQQLSGVSSEEAQRAINQIGADFTAQTVFHQQLTPQGIAVVLVSLIVLPASLIAWGLGWLSPWLALILAVLAAVQLFVYGRGALVTLEYWSAPHAPATTLHNAHIGALQRGRMRVNTFKVILEVQPKDNSPFRSEAFIPVRAENVSKLQRGAVIQVKYLPGVPNSVSFHQR